MARSSSRVVSLVVTLAAAIMMLFPFQNAYSIHFDHPPDNPPPLEVRVDVREVRLLQDVEGLFMDGAELVMETSVEHKDHAVRRVVLQNPDVPDGGTWSVDTNVYTGNDCTPREDVKVDVKLVELDATTMEQIIFALTSTAAGAAAGAVVAAVTVVTAPVSVTIGAAVGLTISVIAIFGSGDDDLGSGSVTYPEGQAMGPRIINLNGKDGRADVDIAGQSITLTDTGQCSPPPRPPPPQPTPGQKNSGIFDPLRQGYPLAESIRPEESGDVTEEEIGLLKTASKSAFVGLAEIIAGGAVQDARGFAGVDGAILDFENAQVLAEKGKGLEAIESFSAAHLKALVAIDEGAKGNRTSLLPFQTSVFPSFFITELGEQVNIVAAVLGTTGAADIKVSGLPHGVIAEVVRARPDFNVFQIRLDFADVPPGAHTFDVIATTDDDGKSSKTRLSFHAEPGRQEEGETFCGRPVGDFDNVVVGTGSGETIWGTGKDDLIRGLGGNDTIFGREGNDCLKGDDGSDRIWGGVGDDGVLGGNGDDRLVGGAGRDSVNGHAGDDRAWGGDGDDMLLGEDGLDRLIGDGGNDRMWGGDDDDKLLGEDGDDAMHGDAGRDRMFGMAGDDRVWGGEEEDLLVGGAGRDVAVGDAGDDRIWGGADDDVLRGENGNDMLVGDAGNDQLYGAEGDDRLYDDAGDDLLQGGPDVDRCYDVVGTNSIIDCEE